MRALLIALGVVAAVCCVAVANIVLLGYGEKRHDPVGRLNPVASLSTPPPVPTTVEHEPEHGDERDD